METEQIRRAKEQIAADHGEWTEAFCIRGNLYTRQDPNLLHAGGVRLRRVVQVVVDLAPEPLDRLRILDLGCLEGMFSIEFARHGASVLGVDGREVNLKRARFVRDALSLRNLEFALDDVRDLSEETYGTFDVVLCLGLLYHLDAADLPDFMQRVASVCRGFVVIDTHISLRPEKSFSHDRKTYWGKPVGEHARGASLADRLSSVWASLDNPESFWLTRPSLYNLLAHSGFSSVYECHLPPDAERLVQDRMTLVAVRGRGVQLFTAPWMDSLPGDQPETSAEKPALHFPSLRTLGRRLPESVRERIKRLLG